METKLSGMEPDQTLTVSSSLSTHARLTFYFSLALSIQTKPNPKQIRPVNSTCVLFSERCQNLEDDYQWLNMKALLLALVAPTFIVGGDRVTCRPGYAPSKVRLNIGITFLVVIIKMLPLFVKVILSNVNVLFLVI